MWILWHEELSGRLRSLCIDAPLPSEEIGDRVHRPLSPQFFSEGMGASVHRLEVGV